MPYNFDEDVVGVGKALGVGGDRDIGIFQAVARAALNASTAVKQLRVAEARIEVLEKAIACATIIGWKEDELPDEKNMIMGTALRLVRQNLKSVYPLKIIEDAKALRQKDVL